MEYDARLHRSAAGVYNSSANVHMYLCKCESESQVASCRSKKNEMLFSLFTEVSFAYGFNQFLII